MSWHFYMVKYGNLLMNEICNADQSYFIIIMWVAFLCYGN